MGDEECGTNPSVTDVPLTLLKAPLKGIQHRLLDRA